MRVISISDLDGTLPGHNDFHCGKAMSADKGFAITNLCAQNRQLGLSTNNLNDIEGWRDLATDQPIENNKHYLELAPYQPV